MKTTSLFRLGFAAILLSVTSSAWAAMYEYNLRNDKAVTGWSGTYSVNSSFNNGQTAVSPSFDIAITNFIFTYHVGGNEGTRYFHCLAYNSNGTQVDDAKMKYGAFTTNLSYAAELDVRQVTITLTGGGSKGTWYADSVTVYTLDPPPIIAAIEGGTAKVGIPFERTITVSSDVPGDQITPPSFTASPAVSGASIANGTFTYTPVEDDVGKTITFTINASGNGGAATPVSFEVEVVAASQNTAPAFDPIADTCVLALRTLSIPVTIVDAEGDTVTTNAPSADKAVTGPFSLENGTFSYTPALADFDLSPITFTVTATDSNDATGSQQFVVTIIKGKLPVIAKIATNTVSYGYVSTNVFSITEVDGDDIVTNVAVKAGSAIVPQGGYSLNGGKFLFEPAIDDVGKTFDFTVGASDIDGTASRDFAIVVTLAPPVLKPMTFEDFTTDSVTIDIEAETPGATSYTLYYYYPNASVTNEITDLQAGDFPKTITNLENEYYRFRIKGVLGDVASDWSEKVVYPLRDFKEKILAVKVTHSANKYTQDFNTLSSDTDGGYWFDGRTLQGWYATTAGNSCDGNKYKIHAGGTEEKCLFSARVDNDDLSNRAFGARPAKSSDAFVYGVVFTNMCSYAITNITISFTGMQFRKQAENKYTTLSFAYAKNDTHFDLTTSGINWHAVTSLNVRESVYTDNSEGSKDKNGPVYPVPTTEKSGSLSLLGEDAVKPGETFAIRWTVNAVADCPSLGIDDLVIKFHCAWPTFIMLY